MAAESLNVLTEYLYKYYGKNVIILLDEYDTPMQEAYVNGYWEEMASFIRSLFNAAFKTDPHLERAIMTGITRVGKESIFSDLNNLEVVTTTSEKYEDSLGFTEEEVFAAYLHGCLTLSFPRGWARPSLAPALNPSPRLRLADFLHRAPIWNPLKIHTIYVFLSSAFLLIRFPFIIVNTQIILGANYPFTVE